MLLAQIEQAQLARRSDDRDPAYVFKHALVQEAAYASLLKHDRKHLHRLVGEALERLTLRADRLDEYAPQLGHHFNEAGDVDRAVQYFTLAGDQAARVYANAEAVEHYSRALEIVESQTPRTHGLQDLYLKRGQALLSNSQYFEAADHYTHMEQTALERADRSLELASLIAQATLRSMYSPAFDVIQAQTLSDRALVLARALNDRAAEARILWNLMRIHSEVGGDPHQAIVYGETALTLARELQLSEQYAFTLNDVQYAYRAAGQFVRANVALDEARQLWRERGHLHMLSDNLNQSAINHFYLGDFAQALALTDEAWAVGETSYNTPQLLLSRLLAAQVQIEQGDWRAAAHNLERAEMFDASLGIWGAAPLLMARSTLYTAAGDIDRAIELVQQAYQAAQRTPLWLVFNPPLVAMLARWQLQHGDLAAALETIAEMRHEPREPGQLARTLWGEHISFAESELALAQQSYSQAADIADQFVDVLRQMSLRRPLPEALHIKAQALLAQHEDDQAHDALTEARATAEAIGSRRTAWLILVALSGIESRRGNEHEAQSLRQQARSIIDYIANHCPPDPSALPSVAGQSLRESFLNLPDVHRVMSDE
jgi:tetratricopeptide (TPR) repeat protein